MISLDRMSRGALLERFNLALGAVARNIVDPNADPEKKRAIVIKITFESTVNSEFMKTEFTVDTKLVPPKGGGSTMLIGQDLRNGRIEVAEMGQNGSALKVPMIPGSDMVNASVVEPRQQKYTEPVYPPPEQSGTYDPETGEIYEQQEGPIDLRKRGK